ncbi:MAG: family acetyltransferase [Myxococcales bacterium]|nr:family acetyltransferase [Myxococcales bacterium]
MRRYRRTVNHGSTAERGDCKAPPTPCHDEGLVSDAKLPDLSALVPPLDTPRLTFRGHRLEDFDECAALWADPVVTRFIGGKPASREEVWARLMRYVGHWALLGYGYWVVRERASGRFVGEVGLADFRRAVDPPLDGAPECGWVLSPWAHGQGFATEAVSAVLAWGATRFDAGVRTVCLIDPGNVASIRVAAKCGYTELARTTYKGEPTILYQR